MGFGKGAAWKGNRKGRPKTGLALAENIRRSFTADELAAWIGKMKALAIEAHSDANARIKASDWLAKNGWQNEAKQALQIDTAGPAKITVIHELHKSDADV